MKGKMNTNEAMIEAMEKERKVKVFNEKWREAEWRLT
jgi:protein-tyrosine phosphatase